MTNNKYIVRSIRRESQDIEFYLYGIDLFIDDMYLCTNYIKQELKPSSFDYNYDWLTDTYESGYFVKDKIRVKINWSIYSGYDFTIDKYSTEEQIAKVRKWIEQIFEFLVNHESAEKKYLDVESFECEEIVPIKKPVEPKKPLFIKIKHWLFNWKNKDK